MSRDAVVRIFHAFVKHTPLLRNAAKRGQQTSLNAIAPRAACSQGTHNGNLLAPVQPKHKERAPFQQP